MNKCQEALDFLKDTNCDEINNCKQCPFASYCMYYQWINTLQKLVDKETPKKLIKEIIHDEYDCDDRSYDFEYEKLICPNCSEDLINEVEDRDFEGWNYCPNCGQKLDWSEEDEDLHNSSEE